MYFNLSSDPHHASSSSPATGSPSPSLFKPTSVSQSFKQQPQGQLTPTREDHLIPGYAQQYQHILQQSPTTKHSNNESQSGQAQQFLGSSRLSNSSNTVRTYSFQLNQLGVSSTPRSRREKSADRFIPQMKVSSNYFSLLLSEHKLKRKKQPGTTGNDLDELDQQQQMEHLGSQYSERIAEDDGNSASLGGQEEVSDEDAYSLLLRNNIVKEVNDFNNQPSMNNSCNSNALKMHSRQAMKAPKVLTYTPRMSIAKQQLFLAQSDDIVFQEEPQESRKISSKPYKILDAPGLSGDFYTNILDWSSSNLVVVALNNQIYTWSPIRHDVNNLSGSAAASTGSHGPNPNVVSLSCKSDGKLLATADEHGYVKLYDIERSKIVQEFQGHNDRIGAIAWNENLLTTASKDFTIKLRDIRTKTNTSVLNLHKEQVCGIKWSYDGVCLASGGNDNRVCVYNHKMNKLSSVFSSHSGAVKALAWSPHKHNILVSGGGNKDQTLKFWNTQNNTLMKSIHTGSQVCNMVFSKHQNEILTTHGFQLNQVSLWRADTYQQVATLYGHSERVLYLALSPDHEDIVTGSADETLRFWKVFGKKKKREGSANNSSLDPFYSTIR